MTYRRPRVGLLALAMGAFACAGCQSSDDAGAASPRSTTEAGTDDGGLPLGSVVLRFQLGGSAVSSRNLVDPLEGPVYGSIFRTSDVTLTGPAQDAEAIMPVRVDSVDLRARSVSEAAWTAELPAGAYTFLGFWDIDHSSPDDAGQLGPENGDPVPLADTNQFIVEAGQTTEYTATFEIIYAFD